TISLPIVRGNEVFRANPRLNEARGPRAHAPLPERPDGISRSNDCCLREPRRSTARPGHRYHEPRLNPDPGTREGEPGPPGGSGGPHVSANEFLPADIVHERRSAQVQPKSFGSIRREIERDLKQIALQH